MKTHFVNGLKLLAALLLCFPVSFFFTIMLFPFWIWLERTFGIEAAGHSGPSEWCFLVVYVLCVVLAIVGGFQFGSAKALSVLFASFVLLVVLLLFMPLPHGDSLGVALLHEVNEWIEEVQEKGFEEGGEKAESDSKLYQKLKGRFKGALEFNQEFNMDHWQKGTVLGERAWLDTKTGIIWGSETMTGLPDWGGEGLQSAIDYCASIEPKGFWSLPTNAEFALGIKSKMQNYIDNLTGKWVAQLYSSGLTGLHPMPSLVGFSNQGIQEISVRCVGRTSKAPLHGFIRDDITNKDVMGMINR